MQHRKRQITLKQRMGLCLAAFFAAFAMQLTLNGYQSRAVQAVQDAQMGCFNAISRFQGGVESSISVLENYRWENSEPEEIIDRLQSASSTCNAWLWRIGTSLNSLESVSDEQWVLYSAVDTVYQTYTGLLDELENDLLSGNDAAASQLYYAKVVPCGDYLSQYTLQLLETAIQDSQTTYTTISALNERITMLQTVVVALCVALGCVTGLMVMRLLTPVQQMIAASRAIGKSEFDTPDIPLPKQPEIAQLAESFNIMKHSMAQQVTTLQEKNEIERELHRQKTEALELQNRMERSRLQQLRSQIDPHFLFNTLNVIQQTAGTETAYRTQALIMALSHLLRYSLMSNDEQVPLSREVRIVDEYYSIYHVRFGERVRMEWRFSDSLDLTETMVPSFILQPIVENAFKHGICPKEEGGVVRIRVNPLREKGMLCIRVVDNGVGIQPDRLRQLRGALSQPGERGRIALRNPQAFSGLFFPFDGVTRSFYRPAFQGAFEPLRIDKLKVNQRAGIVIQRDNHITGAERHAAGFMHRRQYRTFPVGEALAGQVGVAAGRSGVLHEPDGQCGRRLAVSLRFSLCGRNHFRGNRWQVAGHGVHLPGSL